MLPAEITDFAHSIGYGVLAVLLLFISIMSFIVHGPLILIEMYGLTPLQAGLVVLVESLARGTAAIAFAGVGQDNEPRLLRLGAALMRNCKTLTYTPD